MVRESGPYCVTGSWRYKIPELRRDVARTVREESLNKGRKLIVGGALEADLIATKVLLNGLDSWEKIEDFLEIYIPAQTMGDYLSHYGDKYENGEITHEQATAIPKQLYELHIDHPDVFVFLPDAKEEIGKFNYYISLHIWNYIFSIKKDILSNYFYFIYFIYYTFSSIAF